MIKNQQKYLVDAVKAKKEFKAIVKSNFPVNSEKFYQIIPNIKANSVEWKLRTDKGPWYVSKYPTQRLQQEGKFS